MRKQQIKNGKDALLKDRAELIALVNEHEDEVPEALRRFVYDAMKLGQNGLPIEKPWMVRGVLFYLWIEHEENYSRNPKPYDYAWGILHNQTARTKHHENHRKDNDGWYDD